MFTRNVGKFRWLLGSWLALLPANLYAEKATSSSEMIVYVDDSATGANNGSSWQDAFTDLQSALDAAEALSGAVVEIRVAEGTYKPSKRTDLADPRSTTFVLPSGTRIFGGFTGTDPTSPRDWNTHLTILSGDLLGDDSPGFLNRADNAYHVLQSEDFYPQNGLMHIDGLTVRGGHSDVARYNFGAGLMAYGGVTLQNCTFEDNWTGPATADGTVAHSNGGGAVTVFGGYDEKSVVQFSWGNCRFIGNSTSGTGGAVFLAGIHIDFSDCLFQENFAGGGGAVGFEPVNAVSFRNSKFNANTSQHGAGAIWSAYYIPSIEIVDSEFKQNSGATAGAIDFGGGTDHFVLSGSTFESNVSEQNGGGLYLSIWSDTPAEIANCYFSDNQAVGDGGALLFDYGSLTLSDCIFENNQARVGGAVYGSFVALCMDRCEFSNNIATAYSTSLGGGAIASEGIENLEIRNSVFEGNSAELGGALNLRYVPTMEITKTSFTENNASIYGGAIDVEGWLQGRISECTFKDNDAMYGGALYFGSYLEDLAAVVDCVFQENWAQRNGGAIYSDSWFRVTSSSFDHNRAGEYGGAVAASPDVDIDDCLFQDNFAERGGGVYLHSSYSLGPGTLSDSKFVRNRAIIGGGLATEGVLFTVSRCGFTNNHATVGGAMSLSYDEKVLVQNSIMISNSAMYGGAIAAGTGLLEINNCTVVNNSASALGGGVIGDDDTFIRNSIFWENQTGATDEESVQNEESQITDLDLVHVDYSIIQEWSGDYPGVGNIVSDPRFVRPVFVEGSWDPLGANLRLLHDSPAFNAGDPGFVPGNDDADLDGHSRRLCGRVDMGAYESGIGDAGCDGIIDLSDFSVWVSCSQGLEEHANCAMMDFDNDDDFDLMDFAGMQRTIGN